ncbi:MAG: hypothetical protein CVT68_08835 [Actinobacteria bacterium HGW-Actinobacteria-8]|nr:MAG: hypothetical protein CVT68_08835 [Actinobacteria bacterium HGW-Actinobacteria-8]
MRMWGKFVRAILKGEWKLSPMSWVAAIGTLIYVVSPIDVIPELFLPFIGYIDDLGLWGVMSILAAREKGHWEASLRDGAIEI